jgi:hypothetical protein
VGARGVGSDEGFALGFNPEDAMSTKHFYLVAIAVILGCSSVSGTSDTSGMKPARGSPKILTTEEIAANHADVLTLYDAIARLRPNWLVSHGPMSSNPAVSSLASVFVDGQQYGELISLRNIPAYQVAAIHYYDVTEAGAKFGVRGGYGGAIEITSKVGR